MTARVELLVGTTSEGKLREVAAALAGLPVAVRSLSDIDSGAAPEEVGLTFEANAALKAMHYARRSRLLSLADDSGLCVDALGGAPGVYSARYGGTPRSDEANNARLLDELRDVPAERRTASFRCAMALSDGAAILARASGHVAGWILVEPRGDRGFGYDPLFFLPEWGRSMAELTAEEKNSVSHRGRAVRLMVGILRSRMRAAGALRA